MIITSGRVWERHYWDADDGRTAYLRAGHTEYVERHGIDWRALVATYEAAADRVVLAVTAQEAARTGSAADLDEANHVLAVARREMCVASLAIDRLHGSAEAEEESQISANIQSMSL